MKKTLRYVLAAIAVVLSLQGARAAGWPAGFQGVMLQGFWWDSYQTETKWNLLQEKVGEYSPYFKLIWVPNSAKSSGGLGYMPIYWFTNHNSNMGNERQLRNMIAAYKEAGVGIIADVVLNHRVGKSSWADFPEETWNGQTWKIGAEGVCSDDEWSGARGGSDTGERYDSARDLDHNNANVQNNAKNYCKCLLEDFGYAGFRLDMVKGYSGKFTKIYNEYSKPTYSVGEYWSGYDDIAGWIEATGRTSAAFDFPFKYACNEAFGSNDMTKLVWKANGTTDQPAGMIHYGYQQYAVTFIDNHDTYRDHNKFNGNVVAANAFMLCSPGTPCVFLPHWNQYKSQISKLINARNAVGVSNTSQVTVLKVTRDCYMAEVKGTKGKLVIKVGSSMDSPAGYSDSQIYCSGNGYCVWTTTGGGGGGIDPVYPSTLYLQGHVNGYDWSPNMGQGAAGKNGVYTFANVTVNASVDGPGFFSFCTVLNENWDVVNSADRYGAMTKDEAISMGGTASVSQFYGGSNASECNSWSIAPGTYTFVVDLSKMTLKVTDGEEDPNPNPEVPGKLYLQGHVNGYDWSTSAAMPATAVNGVFTFAEVTVDDCGNGGGYFAFCTELAEDWDTLNAYDRYGAAEADTELEMNSEVTIRKFAADVDASGCYSWFLPAGKYTLVADFGSMKLKVANPSAIEAIEANGGVVEYYNLQGIRVERPRSGSIYIMRSGSIAKKVRF